MPMGPKLKIFAVFNGLENICVFTPRQTKAAAPSITLPPEPLVMLNYILLTDKKSWQVTNVILFHSARLQNEKGVSEAGRKQKALARGQQPFFKRDEKRVNCIWCPLRNMGGKTSLSGSWMSCLATSLTIVLLCFNQHIIERRVGD